MKNYLLMADENLMLFINQLLPKLQFLEVGGLDLKEIAGFKALVTPVPEVKMPEVAVPAAAEVADKHASHMIYGNPSCCAAAKESGEIS